MYTPNSPFCTERFVVVIERENTSMVQNLVKKGLNALSLRQTTIFSAALFIFLTTVISQILGVFKYRLLVSIFGNNSPEAAVFLAAFRIPDFVFQVLIASAFSSAFIPVFTNYLSRSQQQEGHRFASSMITLGISIYAALSLLIVLFAYPLSSLIAPGFPEHTLELMANLTRIILFTQFFFILGTASTALLQSYHHFLIPGIASTLYNLGIIIGIALFTQRFGIYGAAIGVLLGSALLFFIQLPLLKQVGFKFQPLLEIGSGVKKVLHLIVPRSLTIFVAQLSLLASLFFISLTPPESNYLIFELAQTLVFAPVVLLGQSIAQASFPSLSLKRNHPKEFLSIFLSSFNQILYLTLPISTLLIVLRIPIVRLFYGASKFDWQATVNTGYIVSALSISISAQALTYLLSRTFYAHEDTRTPFYITVFSTCLYFLLASLAVFVYHLPIYYLALCLSMAYITSVGLLVVFIDRKISLPKWEVLLTLSKTIIATLAMGVGLYIPIKLLDQLVFDTTRTINLLILTGIASSIGFSFYIFFSWLLDIKEAYSIIAVIRQFGNWRKMLQQIGELIDGSKVNP